LVRLLNVNNGEWSRFASLSAEDIQKLEADQDATNTKSCIFTNNTCFKIKLSYDKINIELQAIELNSSREIMFLSDE
jgi:hypothetical protein